MLYERLSGRTNLRRLTLCGDTVTIRDELKLPGTKARNEIYATEATKLYLEAGRAAIAATPGIEASDITHVVTTCTSGWSEPGI